MVEPVMRGAGPCIGACAAASGKPGGWVYVCGPSGAGKDSLLAWVGATLAACPRVVVSRRWITRPAQAGSDHEPLSDGAFAAHLDAGQIDWHWHAHGVRYGIPASYRQDVMAGRWVLVNGSRAHLAGLKPGHGMRIVHITAPLQQIRQRLKGRGRDDAAAIERRLRALVQPSQLAVDLEIVNDGDLSRAGQTLVDQLRRWAQLNCM